MAEIIEYAELLRRGWTRGSVRQAVRDGRLRRVDRGVYADGAASFADRVRAVLATRPDAVASFRTAAALHGFADEPPILEITVPHRSSVRPALGLAVHRASRPLPTAECGGIRTTSAIQTVLDLARWGRGDDGVCYADAAYAARLCSRHDVVARLPRLRGLDGAPRARRAIASSREGAQSWMETRTRLLLVRAGLPEPELQVPVALPAWTAHIDIGWPAARVGVEYDGRDAHDGEEVRVSDRRRWRALRDAGWDVRPITAADLRAPEALVAEIRRAVGDGLASTAAAAARLLAG